MRINKSPQVMATNNPMSEWWRWNPAEFKWTKLDINDSRVLEEGWRAPASGARPHPYQPSLPAAVVPLPSGGRVHLKQMMQYFEKGEKPACAIRRDAPKERVDTKLVRWEWFNDEKDENDSMRRLWRPFNGYLEASSSGSSELRRGSGGMSQLIEDYFLRGQRYVDIKTTNPVPGEEWRRIDFTRMVQIVIDSKNGRCCHIQPWSAHSMLCSRSHKRYLALREVLVKEGPNKGCRRERPIARRGMPNSGPGETRNQRETRAPSSPPAANQLGALPTSARKEVAFLTQT